MSKRIAILQSNYIPWKGYFDIINFVDEFILLDEVQYTKRDWRNRNQIKTKDGLQWLSIPINSSGNYTQAICDMQTASNQWREKHWNSIQHTYGKAKYFQEVATWLKPVYLETATTHLSSINFEFIKKICEFLGINTPITWSSDYNVKAEDKTKRLVDLCQEADATHYFSGPAAKNYIDLSVFEAESISVEWMDYSDYPEYDQAYGAFEHTVSILDLLFHTGSDAANYMKSFSP